MSVGSFPVLGLVPLLVAAMACGQSASGPAAATTRPAPPVDEAPASPPPAEPAPARCGTAQRADSVAVVQPPFLTEGSIVIYTTEGPSGASRSFSVCGHIEEPLTPDTFADRMRARGLTLGDAGARIAYATLALRVRAQDQLVLLQSADALVASLTAGNDRLARQLHRRYQGSIVAPVSEGRAPWTLVYWALTRDLLRIEVVLAVDGSLTVTEAVREEGLPVPARI